MSHPPLSMAELDAGLDEIRRSPRGTGRVELIVRRPAPGEREILQRAELTLADGLVGDGWKARGSKRTPDGSAHPGYQVTLINARLLALIAGEPDRRSLSGDQFVVDLDLSVGHLPTGSRLALGSAILEITEPPHTGCVKFAGRFGNDALKFVNTPEGRALRLRGAHAKVVQAGVVKNGEAIRALK